MLQTSKILVSKCKKDRRKKSETIKKAMCNLLVDQFKHCRKMIYTLGSKMSVGGQGAKASLLYNACNPDVTEADNGQLL